MGLGKGGVQGIRNEKGREGLTEIEADGREDSLGEMRWGIDWREGKDRTVEAWEAGTEEMKGMGRMKWEGGRMLKGIMGTKQNRDLGAHFPGRARLTRLRPGALQARYVHDRVRATEAHELGAAPQRLPQRSRLLAEAPLTLPEARQAQHPQRLPSGHSAGTERLGDRKRPFPERKLNYTRGRDQASAPP